MVITPERLREDRTNEFIDAYMENKEKSEERQEMFRRYMGAKLSEKIGDRVEVNYLDQGGHNRPTIDATDAVNRLSEKYFTQAAVKEYGSIAGIPRNDVAKRMRDEARMKAKREVLSLAPSKGGAAIYISDEEQLIDAIADLPPLVRTPAAILAPRREATYTPQGLDIQFDSPLARIGAALGGPASVVMSTSDVASGQEKIVETDAQGRNRLRTMADDGELTQAAKGALIGVGATAEQAVRMIAVPFSDEETRKDYLRRIREDPMGMIWMEQQAERGITAFDIDPESNTAGALRVSASIFGLAAIDIASPDPITPAIGVASLAGRSTRGFMEARRFAEVTNVLTDAERTLRTGGTVDVATLANRMDAVDPGIGLYFRLRLAQEYQAAEAAGNLGKAQERVGLAADRAGGSVKAAEDNLTAAVKADTDKAAGIMARIEQEMSANLDGLSHFLERYNALRAQERALGPQGVFSVRGARQNWTAYRTADREIQDLAHQLEELHATIRSERPDYGGPVGPRGFSEDLPPAPVRPEPPSGLNPRPLPREVEPQLKGGEIIPEPIVQTMENIHKLENTIKTYSDLAENIRKRLQQNIDFPTRQSLNKQLAAAEKTITDAKAKIKELEGEVTKYDPQAAARQNRMRVLEKEIPQVEARIKSYDDIALQAERDLERADFRTRPELITKRDSARATADRYRADLRAKQEELVTAEKAEVKAARDRRNAFSRGVWQYQKNKVARDAAARGVEVDNAQILRQAEEAKAAHAKAMEEYDKARAAYDEEVVFRQGGSYSPVQIGGVPAVRPVDPRLLEMQGKLQEALTRRLNAQNALVRALAPMYPDLVRADNVLNNPGLWQRLLKDIEDGTAFQKMKEWRAERVDAQRSAARNLKRHVIALDRDIRRAGRTKDILDKLKAGEVPEALRKRYQRLFDRLEKARANMAKAQDATKIHENVIRELLSEAQAARASTRKGGDVLDAVSGERLISVSENARLDPTLRMGRTAGLFSFAERLRISPVRLKTWIDREMATWAQPFSREVEKYGQVNERLAYTIGVSEQRATLLNDDIAQIMSQGPITGSRLGRTEEAASALLRDGRFPLLADGFKSPQAENLVRLMTSNDPIQLMSGRASIFNNMGKNGETPWQAFIQGVKNAEEGNPIQSTLHGLAVAYAPPGITLSDDMIGGMIGWVKANVGKIDVADEASFRKFMADLWEESGKPHRFGKTDGDFHRSFAIATANVGKGATVKWLADDLASAALGQIPKETVEDINRIWGSGEGGIKSAGNVAKATDYINNLGVPLTRQEHVRRVGISATRDRLKLIHIGKSSDGGDLYVMDHLIKEIDQKHGDIIKQVTRKHEGGGSKVMAAVAKANQLWRTSAVQGLLIPKPSHWTNTVFGDFTQIWIERGFFAAAGSSARTLGSFMPWGRNAAGRWMDWLKSSNAGGRHMASAMESMLDPDIHRVLYREQGTTIRGVGGFNRSADELGRWAAEDGILDAFVLQEFLRTLERQTPGFIRGAVKGWQETLNAAAVTVTQRQRLSLYLNLLKKGVDRKEARAITLRSLYDWNNGITSWEAATIARIAPFWRFQRLGMRQMTNAIFDPFVDKGIHGLFTSRLKNLRNQIMVKERLLDGEEDETDPERQEYEALGRFLRPDYLGNRGLIDVDILSPAQQLEILKRSGRYATHSQTVLPPGTTYDILEIHGAIFQALTGMAMVASGQGGFTPDANAELIWKPLLGMMGPASKEGAAAFVERFGEESGSFRPSGKLTGAEAGNLEAYNGAVEDLPLLNAFAVPMGFEGRSPVIDPKAAWILRQFPVIMQMSPIIRQAREINLENDPWFFIREYGGVQKTTYFNANSAITSRQKAIQRELDDLLRDQGLLPPEPLANDPDRL